MAARNGNSMEKALAEYLNVASRATTLTKEEAAEQAGLRVDELRAIPGGRRGKRSLIAT